MSLATAKIQSIRNQFTEDTTFRQSSTYYNNNNNNSNDNNNNNDNDNNNNNNNNNRFTSAFPPVALQMKNL